MDNFFENGRDIPALLAQGPFTFSGQALSPNEIEVRKRIGYGLEAEGDRHSRQAIVDQLKRAP